MSARSNQGYKAPSRPDLPTVLAVDDVFLNLMLVKKTLSDIVNLFTVNSAEDAIRVLGLMKVDLLLLDLQMPEMNGFEFMERLRVTPGYEDVPVIIVTANAKLETIEKTLRYGIVDYITKPFEPNLLREKVSKAVANLRK